MFSLNLKRSLKKPGGLLVAGALVFTAAACGDDKAAQPGFLPGTYALGIVIDDDLEITAADYANYPDHYATGSFEVTEDGAIEGSVFVSYTVNPYDAVGDNTEAEITGTVDADGNAEISIGDLLTLTGTFYADDGGAAGLKGDVGNDEGDFGDAVAVLVPGTGDIDFICGHVYWNANTSPAYVNDDDYAPLFIAVQDDAVAGAAIGEDFFMTFEGEVGENLEGSLYEFSFDFEAQVAADLWEPGDADAEEGEDLVEFSGHSSGFPDAYLVYSGDNVVNMNAGFTSDDDDSALTGSMNANEEGCDYD